MKEEPETRHEENTERAGESSANFLGEIPEAWKHRARAAFGYLFCLMILIAVSCEIAVRMFPEAAWLASVTALLRQIGYHLYHYSIGLGAAIIAPCLVWENIMYLREKRRREKAEALAATVNAELQREREAAEAAKAQLQHEVSTLTEQVARLTRELEQLKARSQSSNNENG